ncbi:MAG: HAD-IA family hydrolase [Oscillospiraceae bacterium]|jgi:phosphoglycolate phosphatase|nr:HAD-IA family hydrolase [Oscillospiraceae bacterium]
MHKYDAVIWDMDGTLLNTLDDLRDSVNAALAAFSLPPRTPEEIRRFIGNGVLQLLTLSVPDGRENPRFEEIFSFFSAHYSGNFCNRTRPYAGLERLLPALKRRGYKLAIVSNKVESALKALAAHYFGGTIALAIGDTEGIRRKPWPDKLLHALEILGVEKKKAVYIGDTEVDIQTAGNAGIDCICVSWGFRDRPELLASGAKVIVDSPEQLLQSL